VDRSQHPGHSALLGGAGGAAGGGVAGGTIEYGVWVKWPENGMNGQYPHSKRIRGWLADWILEDLVQYCNHKL
jgi:hypothetical protein